MSRRGASTRWRLSRSGSLGCRFFCNLLDAGRIGLCGEESFGTGSSHTREKDGLWAVLFWMNVLAALDTTLPRIADAHWCRYGRHYFQRHDYDIPDAARGQELVDALVAQLPELPGTTVGSTSSATRAW
ncbi:MAG: hypothetical protein HUU35_15655 [Armatimonadetes bacterium]|nr:hypothetical protein [Armatimonadota bacterium]